MYLVELAALVILVLFIIHDDASEDGSHCAAAE